MEHKHTANEQCNGEARRYHYQGEGLHIAVCTKPFPSCFETMRFAMRFATRASRLLGLSNKTKKCALGLCAMGAHAPLFPFLQFVPSSPCA